MLRTVVISASRSIDSCNKFFFVIFDPVPCYHVIARALQRPRLVAIYEAHQPPHPPAPSRERGAPPHACHTHLSATRRRPRRPADGARRRRGGGARARASTCGRWAVHRWAQAGGHGKTRLGGGSGQEVQRARWQRDVLDRAAARHRAARASLSGAHTSRLFCLSR